MQKDEIEKTINKKNIKKQSTIKTKLGYQNLWVGLCGHDYIIEGKAEKKRFNFKKN
jgi:hypothetical protein